MTEDEGRHKEIREKILKDFAEYKPYSSHTGKGDIAFYWDEVGRDSALSYPDMLICKGGRTLIIEIETGNKPKLLFGDACANYHANIARQNDESIDITRKSLLIVLPSEKLGKRGSGKPKQTQLVKELVESQLDYDFFDIVTDEDAHGVIWKWLEEKT